MLSEQKRIGLQIRRARIDKGLKQEELAKIIGKTPGYISNLETGRSGFAVETLKRIAKALDKNLSYFYTWENDISGEPIAERTEEKPKITDNVLQQLIEKLMNVLEERGVALPSRVSDKTDEEFVLELIGLLPPDMKQRVAHKLLNEAFKKQQ